MQRQTNIPIKHEQQPNFDFSRSPALTHTHSGTHICLALAHVRILVGQPVGIWDCTLRLQVAAVQAAFGSRVVLCSVFSVLCYFFFFSLLFTLYLGLKCTSCSPVPPLCTVGVKCFRTQSQLQTPEARQLYKAGVEGGATAWRKVIVLATR